MSSINLMDLGCPVDCRLETTCQHKNVEEDIFHEFLGRSNNPATKREPPSLRPVLKNVIGRI
jgi:NRPS condensation-like uncharacterized protein